MKTGNYSSFNSITEAKNMTGLSGISQCLCGKSKTAGKFLWSKEPIT